MRIYCKLPSGSTKAVDADAGTTVEELKQRVAAAEGLGGDPRCRLLFAGRELEDGLLLADYNLMGESEIHVLVRQSDATASLRTQLRRKNRLSDYTVLERVGGKNVGFGSQRAGGYSLSGVCSYVYRAQPRASSSSCKPGEVSDRHGNPGDTALALKVMLNTSGQSESLQIGEEFEAERCLLSDPARLPPHQNIMSILHSFTDTAQDLPGWDFDPALVCSRTLVLVMPYYPQDLKRALMSARKRGQLHFSDQRAARVGTHLLRAVSHLKQHNILHRDLKLDNCMLSAPGTPDETTVLTDFGMSFDLKRNHARGFRVMLPYDGFRRGGAPITMAPEVSLPKPGPTAYLDYSKNDEWAIGIVLHELLSPPNTPVFTNMEHPRYYSDGGSTGVSADVSVGLAGIVAELLRISQGARLGVSCVARYFSDVPYCCCTPYY